MTASGENNNYFFLDKASKSPAKFQSHDSKLLAAS